MSKIKGEQLKQFELFGSHSDVDVGGYDPTWESLGNETPQGPPKVFPNKPNAGGTIEEKFFSRNGKTYGPYRYLRFREGGKLRSKYLGKVTNGS